MNCPNCQTLCGEQDRFCYLCGTTLPPAPSWKRKGSLLAPFLLLILMSAAGLVAFFATTGAIAPIRTQGSMPWFSIRGGVLYFEQSRYSGSSELTVPDTVAGETVLALSEDCFANCTELTTVILPDTLETVGDGAFSGCTSLRGILIPSSVNVIGEKAFYGCTALEAINIDGSIRIIREDAFDGCSTLSYIFFSGTHREWKTLYSEFIALHTCVFCTDGSFYQAGDPYQ